MGEAPQIIAAISKETRGEKPVVPAGASKQVLTAADAAQFRAEADRHRIAPRFFHVVQDVFAVGFAVGILDGRVDRAKTPSP